MLEELREVGLNRLTPLEALNLLAELKKRNITAETRECTEKKKREVGPLHPSLLLSHLAQLFH